MTLGAILFFVAVFYYGVIDTSWRDEPLKKTNTDEMDVLIGGSDGE